MSSFGSITMLSAATATGAGNSHPNWSAKRTFQASGLTTAGAGAATVDIEVSNDDTNWEVAGTIALTLGTSTTSDGFAIDAGWKSIRANLTAVSGTNAAVTVTGGG